MGVSAVSIATPAFRVRWSVVVAQARVLSLGLLLIPRPAAAKGLGLPDRLNIHIPLAFDPPDMLRAPNNMAGLWLYFVIIV
jgi:hypothetical protein